MRVAACCCPFLLRMFAPVAVYILILMNMHVARLYKVVEGCTCCLSLYDVYMMSIGCLYDVYLYIYIYDVYMFYFNLF